MVAAVPIALLRNELDSRTVIVVFVMLFYVGAYLAVASAFSQVRWTAFRIGFTAGLSLSMCAAVFFVLAMNAISFPTAASSSRPPVWEGAYPAAWVSNGILFVIAIGCWISYTNRQPTENRTVTRYSLLGLAYPYLAFVLVGIVSALFAR